MGSYLVDWQLIEWALKHVKPFDINLINPASLDLRLGNHFLDPATEQNYVLEDNEFFYLHSGRTVLAITMEEIHVPTQFAADLKLKTTPARIGINHSLAGWIDPGYKGKLTLTLFGTRDCKLIPGMRIAQIVVSRLDEEPNYNYAQVGHYMNQQVPTPAWRNDEDYEE